MAHVKLADGRAFAAAVGDAVDDQRTRAADAFAAIAVEHKRFLASGDEALVDHVEHFKK